MSKETLKLFDVLCDDNFLGREIVELNQEGYKGQKPNTPETYLEFIAPSVLDKTREKALRRLVKRMAYEDYWCEDEGSSGEKFRDDVYKTMRESPILSTKINSGKMKRVSSYHWHSLVDVLPRATLYYLLSLDVCYDDETEYTTTLVLDHGFLHTRRYEMFLEALLHPNYYCEPDPDKKNLTGYYIGFPKGQCLFMDGAEMEMYSLIHPDTRDGDKPSETLNSLFKTATGKDLDTYRADVKTLEMKYAGLQVEHDLVIKEYDKIKSDNHRLTDLVRDSQRAEPVNVTLDLPSPNASIPNGEFTYKKAWELFLPDDEVEAKRADPDKVLLGDGMMELNIPYCEWEFPHPDVPKVDESYVFYPETLPPVLYALAHNKNAMLTGHTGTGKSMLANQLSARTNLPNFRVNMDSEITRQDFVGRDVLKQSNGTTVSEFIDGILPQALSQPCILQCDEVDFARPDILYALQSALEDNGALRITEDGGRIVQRHKWCHIFATANTRGQGDEHGMYQGARVQSQAFLDRFPVWVEMDYMNPDDEIKYLLDQCLVLEEETAQRLVTVANNIREAFSEGRILSTISPRGLLTTAHMVSMMDTFDTSRKVKTALNYTVLNKVSNVDATQISEFIDSQFV